ncbi:MAG TPA: hypothetical protein VLY87_01105 [Flavobacterium sp.]|nr:hypothetical protein [Flavobacterium sp.]
MKRIIILMFFTGLLFVSCRFLDDGITIPINLKCDKNIVVDEIKYNQISTNNYGITNVVLNGDCLEVTISSSGCDPNGWMMSLVASENVVETLPIQQNIKVELINNQYCLAVFKKIVSFDLTSIQNTGQNQVLLNIDGWNTPILYQY